MLISAQLIFLLLFAALVSSQLLIYDPTASLATSTLVKASTEVYRWFYKREIASSPTLYEYVEYDSLSNTPLKTQTYQATAASTLKALSPKFTCAVFSDATSASQKLQIVKYDLVSAYGSNIEDLIVSGIFTAPASADLKTYEVSDMCDGLVIDNTVYHFDNSIVSSTGTSAFIADTLPTGANAWTGPFFSQNFDFVAANQGLYVYTERTTSGVGGSYSKLPITTSFLTRKRVLTTDSAIVVFSWVATTDPNVKNWRVDAFSYPTSKATVTSVGSFQGTSYDTTVNAPPTIMVSDSMQTIIVYGKTNAADNFIKGKVFNFASNTSLELSFPTWMTATKSVFDVTDTYFYARNVDNKAGTTSKFHGGYYISGNQLFENFKSIALVTAEMTDWQRSLIYETPSNNLRIVRQHVTGDILLGYIITLQDQNHSPTGQFVLWDKKQGVANADVTGAGTSLNRIQGNGNIFFVSQPSTSLKNFYAISLNPVADSLVVVSAQTDQNHLLKAYSKNMKCALIFDGSDLKTYWFSNYGVSATVTEIHTIVSTLYTGEVIDTTTKFDVSDDCRGARINSKILHYWDNGADFFADTFPSVSGVSSFVNPAFSEDFSVAVVDAGIYVYTAKLTADTPGPYSLARADTFHAKKKTFRLINSLVIFTWAESTAGKFNFKLQFNIISGSRVTKIGEITGQTTDEPNFLVSQKLTKSIVFGKNNRDPTQPFYVGQAPDFSTSSVKNIDLPSAITEKFNQIVITDEFLYARNSLPTDTKHYGYVFFGASLIQSFNQDIPRLSPGYVRSFIAADPLKKMALVYEFTNANFIKLVKDVKKSSMEILNPNAVSPFDMTFSYANGQSYLSQLNPFFGRFMHTSDSGTKLNYIEYDPSQTGKKKQIASATITGGMNVIKGTSPVMDCAVLYVTGGTVYNLAQVSLSGSGAITISDQMTNIVTGNLGDLSAYDVKTAASLINGISVGNGCWAYKIGALIYFKETSIYTKSAQSATAGFASAIFDSNLKFAYAGGKFYKYSVNDYAEIITVPGLQTTIKLYPSLDQTKLLIVSYQILPGLSGYSVVNKLYALNGSSWTGVNLPTNMASFLTAENIPQISFSSSLDSILIFYTGGTATMMSAVCIAINIKYQATANTITPYQIPTKFDALFAFSKVSLFENYLHVMTIDNSVTSQIIYKIDQTNFRFIQIHQKPLTDNDASSFINAKFTQTNKELTVLYQFEPVSSTVINIVKNIFGSTETQSMITGIEPRDGGLLVQGNQVVLCPSGCRKCVSSTTCTLCMTGFGLSGGLCIRCASLCVSCASDNSFLCIGGCVDGYYDEAAVPGRPSVISATTSCLRCDQSCLTCNGETPGHCLLCKVGFYLYINVCIQCIDNCLSCTGLSISPLCSVCKLGYVYSSATKTCVKCIAGCTNCKADKIYECSKCGDGFQSIFSNNIVTSCQPCPAQCKSCLNGVCTSCRNGFRMVQNKCVEQCKLPCITCSENDPTNCASCPAGYTLNGQSCDPDLSCNINKSCTKCPIGYIIAARQCKACNGGANCRLCDAINIDKCASCSKGFYLTDSFACSPCSIIGCDDCVNQAYCSQCKNGYVLTGATFSAKCTKCDDSCETCFDSPVNCDKCASGYTKKGWSCINNNHIKLNITIDRVFASLTTNDYIKIEQDLSERTGKNRNQINIQVLRSGSVVLQATINLANKDQQTVLISALESSFAVNSSIGGYSILESSFLASLVDNNPNTTNNTTIITNTTTTVYQNVYIEDDAKAKEYRDIAVIVGIVIPIGLSNYQLSQVILLVILFILYKKQLIFANSATVKVMDMSTIEINGVKQKNSDLKDIYREDNLGESIIDIGFESRRNTEVKIKETYRGDHLGESIVDSGFASKINTEQRQVNWTDQRETKRRDYTFLIYAKNQRQSFNDSHLIQAKMGQTIMRLIFCWQNKSLNQFNKINPKQKIKQSAKIQQNQHKLRILYFVIWIQQVLI